MVGRTRATVLALVAAGSLVLGTTACQPLPPTPPGGETAACDDIVWGSQAKAFDRAIVTEIERVRAGRHHCYDRLVIDLDGRFASGWLVRYGTVKQPGSGFIVPLRGAADLEIIARAPAYDEWGATYEPPDPNEAVDVAGFDTFRQVAYAGSFESDTTFGLGVRARLPFRAFGVDGPGGAKLVIDVAHSWA